MATEAFESGARLGISAATYWEIAVKDSLGKLRYGAAAWNWEVFDRGLADAQAIWLAISREHTRAYAALPLRHRNFFDRMPIARRNVKASRSSHATPPSTLMTWKSRGKGSRTAVNSTC